MFLFAFFITPASYPLHPPDAAREEEPGISKPAPQHIWPSGPPSTAGQAGGPVLECVLPAPSCAAAAERPWRGTMEPEAFVQEVAEILLPGQEDRQAILPLQGSKAQALQAKKLEEPNPKITSGQCRHPHIIDLCMHPVTHSHGGQGGFAPPFIPILSPSSTGASVSSGEDEVGPSPLLWCKRSQA